MELRHLRFAVTLSEELHFGKAAARLNISQPPFSRHIRQLEDELGVQLFRRTRREVKMTDAGRLFVAQARQILADTEEAKHLMLEARESATTQLVVGFPRSYSGIVVEILRTFGARYPNVRIALRSLSTSDHIRALRSGELQVAFLRLPVADPTLKIEVIAREPLIVAMPECNKFASHKRLRLQALANETHIMFPREMNPGHYDFLLDLCKNAGFAARIAPEADNTCTGLALVAAGLGVSLVPASARQVGWKGVVFKDLEPPVPWTEMAVAYNRESSKSLSAFLNVVREASSLKIHA
jgi:LysR family transcriptional regulator, benzoate and cis,cis-muconate-responsive activator of ben and cat genes